MNNTSSVDPFHLVPGPGVIFPNSSVTINPICPPIPWLASFGHAYSSVHGYIALILCLLGIVSNLFNVIVLNQPSMVSATNFLLTMLAISDGVLMTSYVPFAAYFVIGEHLAQSSYAWSVFLLMHINMQNLLHSLSSNIIVTLACFRVLYVRCLLSCQTLCSMNRARLAVALVFLISTLLTIPCLLSHHIIPLEPTNKMESARDLNQNDLENGVDKQNGEDYTVTYIDNPALIGYLYWNTAIFVKLLPLVCLTITSLIIITTIKRRAAKMRKHTSSKQLSTKSSIHSNIERGVPVLNGQHQQKQLQVEEQCGLLSPPVSTGQTDVFDKPANNSPVKISNSNSVAVSWNDTSRWQSTSAAAEPVRASNGHQSERDKSETRITRLLLTVVLIFMIALLPQAILLFLNGFLGECFTETVYTTLGDFTDLLTIMNSCINFVLYCSMSRQFRVTFLKLFCSWSKRPSTAPR